MTPHVLAADLLLVNGRVLTMDARDAVAQAVAVRDAKIVAIGVTEQGFPFRTLWNAGFPLSFGSDAPGYYPVDPLRDLGTAVAHQTLSGQRVSASEVLTRREASEARPSTPPTRACRSGRSAASRSASWPTSRCSATIR
jgi:predicted amidohydrolase YtcJ